MTRIDDDMLDLTTAQADGDTILTLATNHLTITPDTTRDDTADDIATLIRADGDPAADPDAAATTFLGLWRAGRRLQAVRTLAKAGVHASLTIRIDLTAHADDTDGNHWDAWTDEGIDDMLADICQKTAGLTAAISWHQHNLRQGFDDPAATRTPCIQLIDDLRGLLERDAAA